MNPTLPCVVVAVPKCPLCNRCTDYTVDTTRRLQYGSIKRYVRCKGCGNRYAILAVDEPNKRETHFSPDLTM